MWPPQTAFYHNRSRSPKFGEKLQWPSKKSESNPMKEKFVRLNSVESMASTTSTSSRSPSKEDLERVDANMPPSAKESKWFGHYQNDYQYQPQSWNQHHQQNQYFGQIQQHHPQTHYWPQYQYQVPQQQNHHHHHHHPNSQYWPQYQYQVPYNLTKGQFEVWEMEAMATGLDQMNYCSQHIVYQDPHHGHDQIYYPEESGFSKCVNSFFQWGSALVATAATAVSSTLKETTTSLTSSLNPNAQVFTPSKSAEVPVIVSSGGQHVNTKEIHSVEKSTNVPVELQNHDNSEISSNCNNNTSSIEKQQNMVNDSEPVTPPNEPEIVLKTVNQRKCTPWIPKGSVKVNSDIDSEEIVEDLDNGSSDVEDESEFEVDSVVGNSPRLRLLSVCSSEDGILFEDSPTQLSASPKYKIDTNKCSPFLKSFLVGQDDDLSEEDSDDDDDDDDDWDKISDENHIGVDIDLEQFGLPTIPTILINAGSANKLDNSTKDEVDHNQLTRKQNNINKKKTCCEGDRFPSADFDLDYEQVLKRVQEANKKWDSLEAENSNPELKKTKSVAFSEPLVAGIQLEDPEMADELREARVGEYNCAQRRADQDRYNRLLGPIFKPEHRDKIRSYIAKQQSYLN